MARTDFIAQLRMMGFAVEEKEGNRITFPYRIPVGRFANQEIILGFEVGDDFPANPPSGPHISPRLLPINTGSKPGHPSGAVHESPNFGPEWEYWSRPFHGWQKTDRTVKAYMRHILHLFDTQ